MSTFAQYTNYLINGRGYKTHKQFISAIKDRPFILLDVYSTALSKVKFRCCVCRHTWCAIPDSILQGTGCPVCAATTRNKKLIKQNNILQDNGNWLLIDISTPTYPDATMASLPTL